MRRFQRGITSLSGLIIFKITSDQSSQPRPLSVWRGAALAAVARPSSASANPAKQRFIAGL